MDQNDCLISDCLTLCKESYSWTNDTRTVARGHAFTEVLSSPIYDKDTNTAVIVAHGYSKEDFYLFLACKGTEIENITPNEKEHYFAQLAQSAMFYWQNGAGDNKQVRGIKDLITDFSFAPICVRDDIFVHKGFFAAAQAILDKVQDTILSLIKGHKKIKIILTGHSLGAAVMQVLTLLLSFTDLKEKLNAEFFLYTFGSPHVGNEKFCAVLRKITTKILRFASRLDLIPKILSTVASYSHPCKPALMKESLFNQVVNFLEVNEDAILDKNLKEGVMSSVKYLVKSHSLHYYSDIILGKSKFPRLPTKLLKHCIPSKRLQNQINYAPQLSLAAQSLNSLATTIPPIMLINTGASIVAAGASIYCAIKLHKVEKNLQEVSHDVQMVSDKANEISKMQYLFQKNNEQTFYSIGSKLDDIILHQQQQNQHHLMTLNTLESLQFNQRLFHQETQMLMQQIHENFMKTLAKMEKVQTSMITNLTKDIQESISSLDYKISHVQEVIQQDTKKYYRLQVIEKYEERRNELMITISSTSNASELLKSIQKNCFHLQSVLEKVFGEDEMTEIHLTQAESICILIIQSVYVYIWMENEKDLRNWTNDPFQYKVSNVRSNNIENLLSRLHALVGKTIYFRMIVSNLPLSRTSPTSLELSSQFRLIYNPEWETRQDLGEISQDFAEFSELYKDSPHLVQEGVEKAFALDPLCPYSHFICLVHVPCKYDHQLHRLIPLNRDEIVDRLQFVVHNSQTLSKEKKEKIILFAFEQKIPQLVKDMIDLLLNEQLSEQIDSPLQRIADYVFISSPLYSISWELEDINSSFHQIAWKGLTIISTHLQFSRLRVSFQSDSFVQDSVDIDKEGLSLASQYFLLIIESSCIGIDQIDETMHEIMIAIKEVGNILPEFFGFLERCYAKDILPFAYSSLLPWRNSIHQMITNYFISITDNYLFKMKRTPTKTYSHLYPHQHPHQHQIKHLQEISLYGRTNTNHDNENEKNQESLQLDHFLTAFYFLESLVLESIPVYSLPNSMSLLSFSLMNLSIVNGQLVDLPPAVGCLVHLEHLNISKNQITMLRSSSLKNLKKLKTFSCAENRFTSLPTELLELEELLFIEVNGNALDEATLLELKLFSEKKSNRMIKV